MFAYKPDFEEVAARYDAWWNGAVLDRPLVSIAFAKLPAEQVAPPAKTHATLRDRWLDAAHRAAVAAASARNHVFYADALPVFHPNLGPEVFSAYYGCKLEFGETTSWSVPCLSDWSDASVERLTLNLDGFWFRETLKAMDALIEAGRGRFLVGYTDLHPGIDAIAAFRNPQELCLDMLEVPDRIKALADRVTEDFLRVYEIFHGRLQAAGMPSTTWLPAICRGRYHVPSCDFSCMVSDALFDEIILPVIVRECARMDRSIYHLDGPQALRFLDRLMDVPTIQAIQWVPGAGRDEWHAQIPVYRRIQQRGTSFIAYVPAQDIEEFTRLFRPEGVWLSVGGVTDQAEADAALAVVKRWR
jgi:hypothetical protein